MYKQWHNLCHKGDTCALAGVAGLAAGIPGSKVLINGPLWCYFYALRHLEASVPNLSYRIQASQPDNNAIVYGAEEFIDRGLQQLLGQEELPSLLLVTSSCSMSLIGDDLQGIVGKHNLTLPVLTLDSGGLKGGFAQGYSLAGVALIKALVQEQPKEDLTVNLLGVSQFTYNGSADVKEMVRLLELAGYTVQAVPGAGSTVEEIRGLSRAQLNIVCEPSLGLAMAQELEQSYNTPYVIAGYPYGLQGTLKWLERINKLLPAPDLAAVQQEAQAAEELLEGQINNLRSLWGPLWMDQVLISAPAMQCLCLGQALRSEWLDTGFMALSLQGQLPMPLVQKQAGTQPINAAQQENMENWEQLQEFCSAADRITTQDQPFYQLLHKEQSLLVLGGSNEENTLLRQGWRKYHSLPVSLPVMHRARLTQEPFMGLRGSAKVQEELWNSYLAYRMQEEL